MTLARARIMSAAGFLAACGAAAADVQREAIVVSGDPAGQTGGLFRGFGNARLNEAGDVLFWARRTINTPAANDECAAAIPIGLGGTLFTTAGATSSPPTGCGGQQDVWFTFTDLSGLESVQVQFYVSGADYSQPAVGVYQNNCAALSLIGCASGTSLATITFSPALRSVKLRVGSNAQGADGDGLLVARQLAPGPVAPVSASATDGGLWLRNESGIAPLLQEGSVAAFDPTLIHESMSIAAFAQDSAAVTGSVQAVPAYSTTRGALMSLATDTVGAGLLAIDTVVAPPGPPVPTTPGPAALSAEGEAAYALLDGSALTYGAMTLTAGTAAPGLEELTWVNFDQPGCSASGAVAWRSRLSGAGVDMSNDVALWKDDGSGVAMVARTGQQAPNAKPGIVFAQIGADVGVDSDGDVAFWGELSGPGIDVTNASGIWSDRGGALAAVVRAGQAFGVADGTVFSAFSRRPMMNSRGDIAFRASIAGGESDAMTNSAIIVSRADGSRRVVVREGNAAPVGAPGAVFAMLGEPVINDRGDTAFIATLRGEGVTPQNAQVLCFAGAEHGVVLIARSGEGIEVGGSARTIKEILFGTGRPQAGHGQFNSSGQLLYELVFADRSSALFKGTVVCPADFDGSGIVSVPDIFAYLAAWFAQSPAAEWDGAAGLDAADLFAFLEQWFQGC